MDVHFRLLAMCDPLTFDVQKLVDRATPVDQSPFKTLNRVDMAFHGALNLGRTGDFMNACRDLWDLVCVIEPPICDQSVLPWAELIAVCKSYRLRDTVAFTLLLAEELFGLPIPGDACSELANAEPDTLRRRRRYKIMRRAVVPDVHNFRSARRSRAIWRMEHFPLPKIETWLAPPLDWTKRGEFLRDG